MKNILILFIISQFAFAQKTSVKTILHFSGKIDKYPIEMTVELRQENDSVYGNYYYAKSGKSNYIILNGTFKNNKLDLVETTYIPGKNVNTPTKTGSFLLDFKSNCELNGNWQNAKKDKKLTVALTCLEDLHSFNPKNYSYKLNQYKGQAETFNNEFREYNLINQLDIFNSKKERVQTLSGFEKVLYNNIGEVELEDLNFDGLLDIKIPIYFPDRIKYDGSFLYYIYDQSKNQFVRNTKLEKLEYLTFDRKNKEFEKIQADGRGNESSDYYKWSGNNFYLIREEFSYEDSDKTTYIEYQIKNGKSVKVKEYKK
ncbi:MAG: hypothetical protein J7574_15050 [Flavobacterium sp.]|uniref:XAC2610-related protein n=1 Tax=Flavobacterium sp. TaxID=239 RepID=UPI001B2643F6|nr:hypothetical protein [Flavobacterium sp.]MBO9585480.1 hypothetical protein [Flavobacterium sp.]